MLMPHPSSYKLLLKTSLFFTAVQYFYLKNSLGTVHLSLKKLVIFLSKCDAPILRSLDCGMEQLNKVHANYKAKFRPVRPSHCKIELRRAILRVIVRRMQLRAIPLPRTGIAPCTAVFS